MNLRNLLSYPNDQNNNLTFTFFKWDYIWHCSQLKLRVKYQCHRCKQRNYQIRIWTVLSNFKLFHHFSPPKTRIFFEIRKLRWNRWRNGPTFKISLNFHFWIKIIQTKSFFTHISSIIFFFFVLTHSCWQFVFFSD